MNKAAFKSQTKYEGMSNTQKEDRWRSYNAGRLGYTREAPRRQLIYQAPPTEANPLGAVLHTMPPCAIHYMQALEDPFRLKEAACIPDLHAISSKKVRTIAKFNFSTGANGFGWAVACAQCKANDGDIVVASTASSNATVISTSTVSPSFSTSFNPAKLPYASAAFNSTQPGVEGRVVGTALRVRYIGPVLAKSGQLIGLRHPDNESILGIDASTFKSYETAKTFPVDEEWTYVNYKPVKPSEYEYSHHPATSDGGTNYYDYGFMIVGTTTSFGVLGPAPFEGEVVTIIEYIGNVDNITKTHSDIVAMSHIRNNTEGKSASRSPHKRLLKTMHNIGTDIMQHASPMIKSGISNSVSNFVTSKVLGAGEKAGNRSLVSILGSKAFNFAKKELGSVFSGGFAEILPEVASMALALV